MDRLKELRIDRSEKAPTPRRGGFLLGALVTLLVLAAAGAAWWFLQGRQAPPEVKTTSVRRVNPSESKASVLDASGYVTARLRATVSSKITGKIVEVLVEEGMEVTEGQLLARTDDSTARRRLELSKAQLTSSEKALRELEVRLAEADLQLGRTRQLVEAEVISQAELDRDQAAFDVLEAQLARSREDVVVAARQVALSEQDLADTEIRAPFSGVAVTKNAQPGEMISPTSAGGGFTRTGVCTLVDMTSLEIEVDVNEAYIHRVEPGQRVEAVLDAYPDWRIPAVVITPVPTADRQKATVQVRIGFDQLDPRILPDMGVKVSFLAADESATAPEEEKPFLLVDADAVRDDGGQPVVWVVQNGKVERRAIKLGEARGNDVEVESGLNAGERVILEGPEDLKDGDSVDIP